MTLHIGEISNEVEVVDGHVPPADGPARRSADHQPPWVERETYRRRAEAAARDASRTAEECRHG